MKNEQQKSVTKIKLFIKFRDGIKLKNDTNNRVVISFNKYQENLQITKYSISRILKKLLKGFDIDLFHHFVSKSENLTLVYAEFICYLEKFEKYGLLDITVKNYEENLFTIYQHNTNYISEFFLRKYFNSSNTITYSNSISLSRFVYQRVSNKIMIMESPLSPVIVFIENSRIVETIFELTRGVYYSDLANSLGNELAKLIFIMLNTGKFLSDFDNKSELLMWEFHDLLFHSRSRMGRHTNPYGSVYLFQGKIAQIPPLKNICSEWYSNKKFIFDKKSKKSLSPIQEIIEQRKSNRQHNSKIITSKQLGEFLYRAHGVRKEYTSNGFDIAARPYPSGGAMYELEIYLAVNECLGLDSGLYYYNPKEHELIDLNCDSKKLDLVLENAKYTYMGKKKPQILFEITSRFPRISWKYRSMSYSLTLKHVGVLFQTMYLIGTDMGLAVCALGGGNSDLFSDISGLDYYSEPLIAEFILGGGDEKRK